MNLELQRKTFNIVIGANYVKNYESKIETLSSLGLVYATILHDKDIDNKGVLKNPHWHLIIKLEKRVRAKTILLRLCEILKTSAENIQINECFNFISSVQYLIHKNDSDKFQYDIDNIYHNMGLALSMYLESSQKDIEFTTDMIIDIVESCQDTIDLIRTLGIYRYNSLRNTISDIKTALIDRKLFNKDNE